MRKSVWIEKLDGGYSVRRSGYPRIWVKDYAEAQKRKTELKLSLLAKAQGLVDPTLRPLDIFYTYLSSIESTHRPATIKLKKDQLVKFLTPLESFKFISPHHVKAWKTQLLQGNINTASIKLRELRAFCNWCVNEGYLLESPFQYKEEGKQRKIQVPVGTEVGRKLALEEIASIWKAAKPNFKLKLLFLIYTGTRKGELLKTRLQDIDFTNQLWRIPAANSKSKKERLVPLDPILVEELQKVPKDTQELFSKWNMQREFKDTLERAGITGRARIHDFRHSFASHWKGRPGSLMEMLGWSSMAMVKKYTHLFVEDVRQDALAKGISSTLNLPK